MTAPTTPTSPLDPMTPGDDPGAAAAARAAANPLLAGVGPGAWADRADVPDRTAHGAAKIVPLRADPSFFLEPRDPDPRGMPVIGADGVEAGVVSDVWVDRSEPQVRYLEVTVHDGGHAVLLPMAMARVQGRQDRVMVKAILARHFADVPTTAAPDRVTLREEDRIMAYFAAGHLYATPERREPLL